MPVKFRSRSAETLVLMLALRPNIGVPREIVVENFWPNSDGDKQSQNLRKAVSDARSALQDPEVIAIDQARVWLNQEKVTTDVQEFRQLTDLGLSESDPEKSLRAAVNLYTGSLMPGYEEQWVFSHRREMEERFGQAVSRLIGLVLESGRV